MFCQLSLVGAEDHEARADYSITNLAVYGVCVGNQSNRAKTYNGE